jgi:hypothetical protein
MLLVGPNPGRVLSLNADPNPGSLSFCFTLLTINKSSLKNIRGSGSGSETLCNIFAYVISKKIREEPLAPSRHRQNNPTDKKLVSIQFLI